MIINDYLKIYFVSNIQIKNWNVIVSIRIDHYIQKFIETNFSK